MRLSKQTAFLGFTLGTTPVIGLVFATAHVSQVYAADETPEVRASQRAAARALFDEGVALLMAEKWADAVDRFERARTLQPSARISYNLATALAKLGRYVYAAEILRALDLDPNTDAAVRNAARSRLAEIEKRAGALVLLVEGDVSMAEIALDGHVLERALLSVPIPVDPGEHHLVVRRDGQEVVTRVVQVTEGERQRVYIALPARAAPPPEERPAIPEPPSLALPPAARPVLLNAGPETGARASRTPDQTWWWIGGSAAAALAAGVATFLLWPRDVPAVEGTHGTYRFD